MVDVILHLVDRGLLDELVALSVDEISSAMEATSLRGSRPEADPRFHRDFDVDLEGEVLELIDDSEGLGEGSSLAEGNLTRRWSYPSFLPDGARRHNGHAGMLAFSFIWNRS